MLVLKNYYNTFLIETLVKVGVKEEIEAYKYIKGGLYDKSLLLLSKNA